MTATNVLYAINYSYSGTYANSHLICQVTLYMPACCLLSHPLIATVKSWHNGVDCLQIVMVIVVLFF